MATPKSASGTRRTKISAELARTETKRNRHWRTAFLAALAETSNVTKAAEAACIHPAHAYKVKREEPGFARQWNLALMEGYDALEIDVLHRLRFGEARDGDRKFDNGAALRLLAQHRESVVRERAMRENEDVEAVRASIDAKLAALKAQVLARKAAEASHHDG